MYKYMYLKISTTSFQLRHAQQELQALSKEKIQKEQELSDIERRLKELQDTASQLRSDITSPVSKSNIRNDTSQSASQSVSQQIEPSDEDRDYENKDQFAVPLAPVYRRKSAVTSLATGVVPTPTPTVASTSNESPRPSPDIARRRLNNRCDVILKKLSPSVLSEFDKRLVLSTDTKNTENEVIVDDKRTSGDQPHDAAVDSWKKQVRCVSGSPSVSPISIHTIDLESMEIAIEGGYVRRAEKVDWKASTFESLDVVIKDGYICPANNVKSVTSLGEAALRSSNDNNKSVSVSEVEEQMLEPIPRHAVKSVSTQEKATVAKETAIETPYVVRQDPVEPETPQKSAKALRLASVLGRDLNSYSVTAKLDVTTPVPIGRKSDGSIISYAVSVNSRRSSKRKRTGVIAPSPKPNEERSAVRVNGRGTDLDASNQVLSDQEQMSCKKCKKPNDAAVDVKSSKHHQAAINKSQTIADGKEFDLVATAVSVLSSPGNAQRRNKADHRSQSGIRRQVVYDFNQDGHISVSNTPSNQNKSLRNSCCRELNFDLVAGQEACNGGISVYSEEIPLQSCAQKSSEKSRSNKLQCGDGVTICCGQTATGDDANGCTPTTRTSAGGDAVSHRQATFPANVETYRRMSRGPQVGVDTPRVVRRSRWSNSNHEVKSKHDGTCQADNYVRSEVEMGQGDNAGKQR